MPALKVHICTQIVSCALMKARYVTSLKRYLLSIVFPPSPIVQFVLTMIITNWKAFYFRLFDGSHSQLRNLTLFILVFCTVKLKRNGKLILKIALLFLVRSVIVFFSFFMVKLSWRIFSVFHLYFVAEAKLTVQSKIFFLKKT